MTETVPESLGLIAGRGVYPLLLAQSARAQGVSRIVAFAFKGETERRIQSLADETHWIRLGQLQALLDRMTASRVPFAVMAGQLTPTRLFTVRMDRRTLDLLRRLPVRNAETIFGAVGDELRTIGIDLLPASRFMESHMPAAGLLSRRAPDARETADIRLGFTVAKASSAMDIGQTVVVKEGTVLAVEAFEGTNEAIRRAARLGGRGIVVVKVAKDGHDMRFDIPIIGEQTLRLLAKLRASVLAVEAGRSILLDTPALQAQADRIGLSLLAVNAEYPA